MRRLALAPLIAVVVVAGCGDNAVPTGTVPTPHFLISDGARQNGNPGFFFEPPISKIASAEREYGDAPFTGDKSPDVRICELDGDPNMNALVECARNTLGNEIVVASFSGAAVTVQDAKYQVNWHTDESNLAVTKFYRILVFVGPQLLGFADVDPVNTGREIKSIQSGEIIPLVDGRTLPIKFRIETDALCDLNPSDCGKWRVGRAGGTFVTNTKFAGIQLLDGWLPAGLDEVELKIERLVVGPDNTCHTGEMSKTLWREFEGCYQLTTVPDLEEFGGIQQPAVFGMCTELSEEDPLYDAQQMYKARDGQLLALETRLVNFIDCEGFGGSPSFPRSRFDRFTDGMTRLAARIGRVVGIETAYAIDGGLGGGIPRFESFSTLFWGVDVTLTIVDGDEQSGEPGSFLETSPTVEAMSTHGEVLLEDVELAFSIAGGNGAVSDGESTPGPSVNVSTGSDGRASVSWRLGDAGLNSLHVEEPITQASANFTATGLEFFGIDFERYPNGENTCENCEITGDYVSRGLVLAFEPANEAFEGIRPRLILGGPFEPVGTAGNHSVTAPSDIDIGLIAGTVVLYFPNAPGSVTLRLRGREDDIDPFPVSAYSGPGQPLSAGQITRTNVSTYSIGSEVLGRQETVTFTSPDGISRIGVHMNLFSTLIDNVVIGAVPAAIINFETGDPNCALGCDLVDAFADRGVTFSFQSFLNNDGEPLTTKTNASICDGSRIDPLGFGMTNHLVTVPNGYPCGGGFAGQLILAFDPAPVAVRFATRQPDGCSLGVSATGADEGDPFLSTGDVFHYTSGNEFRGEQIFTEVTHDGGIATIRLTIAGCSSYVDNLVIVQGTP
jgi:hypothetical protein